MTTKGRKERANLTRVRPELNEGYQIQRGRKTLQARNIPAHKKGYRNRSLDHGGVSSRCKGSRRATRR